MKKIFFTIIFSSLITKAMPGGNNGNGVGNGGDAVICKASKDNNFDGYYSLDYLVQYQSLGDIAEVKSLDDSLNRIEKLFEQKMPELAPSFKFFRKNVFNQTDASQIHFWEKSSFGLVDLKDESLISTLPTNCRNGDQLSIIQAVIRVEPKFSGRPLGHYLFRFVPEVVDKLSATNPAQLSFLVVHEWLWDLSNNVDRNRRINYWLHSKVFETWTRDEVIKNLNGVGFEIPQLPAPVFNPEVCPADASSMQALMVKAKERLMEPRTLILGYGSASQGGQACKASENVCSPFREGGIAQLFANRKVRNFDFDKYISVEIYKSALLLRSKENGEKAFEHFRCPLDLDQGTVGECSQLDSGYGTDPLDPVLKFKLVVGKNCMRFSTSGKVIYNVKPVGEYFHLMDYVLYFPTISY